MMRTERGAGPREPVLPRSALPEKLSLDVSELGPRALALIEWLRETPSAAVTVTQRGQTLARLVAVAPPDDSDDGVDWHVEAVAP